MKLIKSLFLNKRKHPWDDMNLNVEVRANMYTLYCLNYALAVAILMWILNILNIFIVEQQLMFVATVFSVALALAPKIVCRAVGVEGKWVKYFIIFFTAMAIAVYGVALSYHAILLFVLPLFFAAQYQSRRFMLFAYIVTLATMYLSVIFSFKIGLCDLNMLFLSAFPTKYYADFETGEVFNLVVNSNPDLTVPLFFFAPRALTLLLFSPILKRVVNMSAESAVMMADLKRLSETDKHTRFYNKNKFEQMIMNYYPTIGRIGVIFWDLNNLKNVNDKYGHNQGDIIISALADCITEQVTNMRRVYRVGGDEFVMVIEEPMAGEVDEVINLVRDHLDQRNATSRIPISAAAGGAEGSGKDVRMVIDEADQKMYMNKGLSKVSEVPDDVRNTILNDRLFDGIATVSDSVYIYLCDMRTNMSRWSKSAVEYFDMPSEFMTDAGDIWLHRIHPEDREGYIEDIEKIFSGQSVVHKCEYRALNKSGEYVWLECRGRVIYDEVRQQRYFSGIMIRMDNLNKYDPLTKLKTFYEFNKMNFEGRIGSLLLIGMDDFRMVVNNYGYAYGDKVLAEFAQRLTLYCGDSRIPYRMEGDEFLIVSPGSGEEDTLKMYNDIRSLGFGLGKDGGHLVNIRFSCGAVLYPDNGNNREVLISNLEHSLQLAKSERRGNIVFFHDDIAALHQRAQIIKDRIAKVAREGFEGFSLNFQPLVRSSDHRIVSCEALLRCDDLAKQGIGIGDVVDYMEKCGEILNMGRWVTEQVFRRAHKWQRQYPDMTMHFNVSAVQFQNLNFVEDMINMSHDFDVDPTKLIIEITESSKIEDYHRTAQCLTELREHGFKIALDDFGIAYSTLLLIKTLPTDYVKIDHAFVLHLAKDSSKKDLMIIEAVIDLCRKMNIDVVAEGVENIETLRILERYPIAYYQGYYFSAPVSEERFIEMVEKNR